MYSHSFNYLHIVKDTIFVACRKKNTKQLFEKLTVIDAGAKGKSVAKAPDGRIIFLSNAIPVMLWTFKPPKKEVPIMKEQP